MFYVLVLFYFLDFTYRTEGGDDFVRGSISFVVLGISFFNYLYINIFIVFYVLLKMRVCLPFSMFFAKGVCTWWEGLSICVFLKFPTIPRKNVEHRTKRR